MCEPIASIIRISVNFFLYGSNFCFFTALGLMPMLLSTTVFSNCVTVVHSIPLT